MSGLYLVANMDVDSRTSKGREEMLKGWKDSEEKVYRGFKELWEGFSYGFQKVFSGPSIPATFLDGFDSYLQYIHMSVRHNDVHSDISLKVPFTLWDKVTHNILTPMLRISEPEKSICSSIFKSQNLLLWLETSNQFLLNLFSDCQRLCRHFGIIGHEAF